MTNNTKLIFLDIEATGLDTTKADIIEIAYQQGFSFTKIVNQLFAPSSPISPEVSGVTNIDNEDVEGCGRFELSDFHKELNRLSLEGCIAVTHNTDYDLGVLSRYGINFDKSVCTLSIAKILFPNLGNHKLGTLRAYFGIPHTGEAHRADYDVKILVEVYKKILETKEFQRLCESNLSIEENAVAISDMMKQEILSTWPFGKYRGQKIDFTDREQRNYIHWSLKNNQNLSPKLKNYLQSNF